MTDITIYTIAYNEEVFMQFFIDHYRSRFSNCRIVVYDNMSTDNTAKIAKDNNCEIIPYDTNNQIQDSRYLQIKNNCWKDATTDWVLICDIDELLEMNTNDLDHEDTYASIVKSCAYNMVNMQDNFDLININLGLRASQYDKSYVFNKKWIKEINYAPGCHSCAPIGNIKYSKKSYPLYHYKYINVDYTIARYKLFATRLSPENKKYNWGVQYNQQEDHIRASYIGYREHSTKVK